MRRRLLRWTSAVLGALFPGTFESDQQTYEKSKNRILAATCIALSAGIVMAGLWPPNFRPENKVSWLKGRNGIRIAESGIVRSSSPINSNSDGLSRDRPWSVQILLQSRGETIGNLGVIVSLHNPKEVRTFTVAQWKSELIVRAWISVRHGHARFREIGLPFVFRDAEVKHLTISSGPEGINIYLDAVLKKSYPEYSLIPATFDGSLVLGSSPSGNQPWAGVLLGLAIHNRSLTMSQVAQQYQNWGEKPDPRAETSEGLVALYLFDEQAGSVVHNHAGVFPNLLIPARFEVLKRSILVFSWHDFRLSRSHVRDLALNILGFLPFAFFTARYLNSITQSSRLRVSLVTIIVGGLLSLILELIQVYLPDRSSSLTDVLCNVFGTALGVMLFNLPVRSSQTG